MTGPEGRTACRVPQVQRQQSPFCVAGDCTWLSWATRGLSLPKGIRLQALWRRITSHQSTNPMIQMRKEGKFSYIAFTTHNAHIFRVFFVFHLQRHTVSATERYPLSRNYVYNDRKLYALFVALSVKFTALSVPDQRQPTGLPTRPLTALISGVVMA